MNLFKCDSCGAETHMHPPTEPQFIEKETEHQVPKRDKDTGEVVIVKKKIQYETVKKKVKVPKTVKTTVKNPHTHEPMETEVQEVKDLKPRALLVQCRVVGRDSMQKDFCVPCFETKVKPEMKKFLDFLNTFKDQ